MRLLRPALLVLPVAALPVLAACSSSGGGSGSGAGGSVSIKAGDSSCDVARTALDAGTTTFAVKNTGSSVTEVYVYGRSGDAFTKVVGEVENIGPGITRDMKVDLAPGSYEIACKPGQKGDGIRTTVTVAGSGATAQASETSVAKYDREIELSTDGTTITGLSGGAKTGEKVEFKLENKSSGPRTLEIKDPSGTVAGEAEDVPANEDGEVIVELGTAGTWTVVVEGDGVVDITADLVVS